MTNVLHLLDDIPPYSDTDRFNDWMSTVGESLAHHQQEWLSAVARVEQLSKDHGWILLSWIEESANQIVRTPAPDLLHCFDEHAYSPAWTTRLALSRAASKQGHRVKRLRPCSFTLRRTCRGLTLSRALARHSHLRG